MGSRLDRPPLLYAVRERAKWPIVRVGWPLGLDWHQRFVPTTLSGLVLVMKQLGWTPTTCIDVGVAWGTVELQRGFASSRHVLIEPNPMFFDYLAEKSERNGWTLHKVAVSDRRDGVIPFVVPRSAKALASQGGRVTSQTDSGSEGNVVLVPSTTLDALDATTPFGDNLLLKIDVEGHEGKVLAGAAQVLGRVEVAVVETSPAGFRAGGTDTSSEIVRTLLDHDLLLVGFLSPWVQGRDRRRMQMVDLVFARPGSVLLAR